MKKQLAQMQEQNRLMQQQLEKQQEMIDLLNRKVAALASTPATEATALPAALASAPSSTSDVKEPDLTPSSEGGITMGNVKITGEGGIGFFETGQNGYYPDAQFIVDEARLFLDAELWKDVYFYGDVDLRTRESQNNGVNLGELYLEFEDLAHWGHEEDLLNVRAGQFYTPFGEEYQVRYAIDDPLISHSLSDIWGLSSGVELFGGVKKFSYAVAAQSGGISLVDENEADKSIAGRISFDPARWLHLSASAMRTGDVSVGDDHVSAIWFGSGLFHSIGSPGTSLFHDDLAEFDAQLKWGNGSFKVASGYADYNDNDPLADNHRDFYYYYAELVQQVTDKLYGAARFSEIDVAKGYPLVGDNSNDFGVPTTQLWRLSLGSGYRFNKHLTLKAEYLVEHGKQSDGNPRNHENMLAVEGAFKF